MPWVSILEYEHNMIIHGWSLSQSESIYSIAGLAVGVGLFTTFLHVNKNIQAQVVLQVRNLKHFPIEHSKNVNNYKCIAVLLCM